MEVLQNPRYLIVLVLGKSAGKFFIRQVASMLLLVVQGLLHGGVRDVGVVDDPASCWTNWFVQSQVWMLTDFLVEFSLQRKLFWWVESQHLALNSREFYGLE